MSSRDFVMPEIGIGTALFIAAIAFVGGIIVGTQAPLWIQLIVLVVIVLWLNSWSVGALELGALAYMFIGVAMIAGMVVGDISYVIQMDGEVSFFEFNFLDLFDAN